MSDGEQLGERLAEKMDAEQSNVYAAISRERERCAQIAEGLGYGALAAKIREAPE